MGNEFIIQLVALVGILVGAIMSYWTYIQNKRFEIFQIYSEKYNAIISPEDIEWWTQVLNNNHIPQDKSCEYKMLEYFNLASEEYYLYKTKMIGAKLWEIWKPNIKGILSTKFAHRVRDKYQIKIPKELMD
jgi:hypothetical protein